MCWRICWRICWRRCRCCATSTSTSTRYWRRCRRRRRRRRNLYIHRLDARDGFGDLTTTTYMVGKISTKRIASRSGVARNCDRVSRSKILSDADEVRPGILNLIARYNYASRCRRARAYVALHCPARRGVISELRRSKEIARRCERNRDHKALAGQLCSTR